jgi:hypothetical protein
MSERYHRAQILLEPDQYRRLRRIAEREDRSISDVAREMVSIGLDVHARDEDVRDQRQSQALDQLRKIREAALARHGLYQGDLLAEVRSEREGDLDHARDRNA